MTKVTIDIPSDLTVELAILISRVQQEVLTMAVREFIKKLECAQKCEPESGLLTTYLEVAQEIEKQLADHDSSALLTQKVELCMMGFPGQA